MPRDLPTPEFRLRPHHALYLVDLVLAAVIFVVAGRMFMDRKGTVVLAAKEKERVQVQEQGKLAQLQADSVLQAQKALLAGMVQDSIKWVTFYEQKRLNLEAGFVDRQMLTTKLQQLSDQVFGLRDRSQEALQKSQEYEKDVSERKDEIAALSGTAHVADSTLQTSEKQRSQAAEQLQEAQITRTVEPVGLFPDRSGLAVSQQIGGAKDLTSFEFQRVLQRVSEMDLGVSLGVGLGSGETASSSKQVGLLLSRQLIHRRLGVDFGAGYSLLSDQSGRDESSVYATGGIRYSPFYKERLHFGAGARVGRGSLTPYIGVTVGRR